MTLKCFRWIKYHASRKKRFKGQNKRFKGQVIIFGRGQQN